MELCFLFYFLFNFCASKSETAHVTAYLGGISSIKNMLCECAIKDYIPLSLPGRALPMELKNINISVSVDEKFINFIYRGRIETRLITFVTSCLI